MPEPLTAAAFVLVMAALIGWLYWAEHRWPAPPRQTHLKEMPAICARCTWRSGEDCSHPESPARGGPIGEVCAGKVKCRVREARQ
jgi:hypothetical protein